MYKFDKINYYTDKLDVKEVVKEIDLAEIDEALNICDLTVLVEKYKTWRKYLPRIEPYYAVKCNPDDFVLKTLVDLGTGFDCASKNEIKQILEKGVAPDRIVYAHPVRPISHMKYANEKKIPQGTVDSEFEIYKTFKYYPEFDLLVRFRCEAKDALIPLGEKFGCDPVTDAAALLLLAKSLQLNVKGACFHVGSGCNDTPAYGRALTLAKEIFTFGDMLGFDMKLLDIGGGFPGHNDDQFISIANVVNENLEKHFPDNTIKIIAEPGRYFVSSVYTLICKIHAKRDVFIAGKLDTKMYYLNDGVYGTFNCILYDKKTVMPSLLLEEEDNVDSLQKFKTVLWGPSCDALDKIAENVYLPNMSCGDLIYFPDMGAYSVATASTFNGFLLPKTLYFMKNELY